MINLEIERKNRGWTKTFVADQIGVTKQAVYAYENCKIQPSRQTLIQLETLFKKSHGYLFSNSNIED